MKEITNLPPWFNPQHDEDPIDKANARLMVDKLSNFTTDKFWEQLTKMKFHTIEDCYYVALAVEQLAKQTNDNCNVNYLCGAVLYDPNTRSPIKVEIGYIFSFYYDKSLSGGRYNVYCQRRIQHSNGQEEFEEETLITENLMSVAHDIWNNRDIIDEKYTLWISHNNAEINTERFEAEMDNIQFELMDALINDTGEYPEIALGPSKYFGGKVIVES